MRRHSARAPAPACICARAHEHRASPPLPSPGGVERCHTGAPAAGALGEAIDSTFGSFDEFKATFSAKTAAVQGSGWGWLGFNPADNSIAIVTCPNQDPLHATTGYVPLLGVDIWEHAYYLDHRNVRPN